MAPERRKKVSFDLGTLNPFRSLKFVWNNSSLFWIAIVLFVISIPESAVNQTWWSFWRVELDIAIDDNGTASSIVLATLGGSALLVMFAVFPALSKKLDDITILFMGLAVMFGAFLAVGFLEIIPSLQALWVLFCAVLLAFSQIVTPPIAAMVANSVAPEEQGEALGLIGAVKALATACGPSLFGYAYFELQQQQKGYLA